jgi:putative CocE/NonD family hydrolase
MGENNWYGSNTWPTTDVTSYNLYMHSGGGLYPEMPYFAGDFGIIPYDPRDPSPTIGGATLRSDLLQGPYDQATVVESRSDILKFSSIVLGQNVVMKGKATVHLWVSSDRKDTDFSIRLTDVYPDGRSELLAEGIRRLRFRDGYSSADTSSGIPGNVYEVVIDLPDIANTFLAGHRIRVDVTSSNYPRFDCNLNNGLEMYTGGDSLIATNYIYLNTTYASYIQLPLVDYVGGMNENVASDQGLHIYPNPVTRGGDVYYEIYNSDIAIPELFDLTGKIIDANYRFQKTDSKSIYSISTAGLSPGVYIVKYTMNGDSRAQKLVVY